MKNYFLYLAFLFSACGESNETVYDDGRADTQEMAPIACDNPDADVECCFVNKPDYIPSTLYMVDVKEPGKRMIIRGKLFEKDSTPAAGVLIYAYHTDQKGLYSKKGNEKGIHKWHGHLHAWGKSDKRGNFEIYSIRPARYPENKFPAHIHIAVKPPNKKAYYITDFVFEDDDLVNEAYLESIKHLPGGTGIVKLEERDGILYGKRKIYLK